MCGNDEARIHVEAVGIGAVGADAGVEVKLLAAEPSRLPDQPLEQLPAVSSPPRLGQGERSSTYR